MTIKNFSRDDIPGICRLINSELGYNVTGEELEQRVLKMQKAGGYTVFTAVEGERVMGFIGLQSCLAFEIPGEVMRIIALAVARDFQNKGVGGALVRRAESFAEENNAVSITVNSGVKRTLAHKFYEKQGFYKKGYSFYKALNQ